MEKVSSQPRMIKFGVFEIDLQAGELRKFGMRQKLAGQPLQVLEALLERPQEVVTREELRHRLWPENTVVDYELALKKSVNRLRKVLGDSAETPHYIETIPRRGYRYIGPVNGNGTDGHGVTQEAELKPAARAWYRRKTAALFAMISTAALVFGAYHGVSSGRFRQWLLLRSGPSAIRSIAVLPLQNLSSDPEQEYLSDGITDALITDLAQLESLKVISRTSIMTYKKSGKSLPEIARELGVDAVVEGTVQRSGDRVRITAQLIYGPADKHLWAHSYERDMRDVFTLERDVTRDIARQIQARILTANPESFASARPVNLEALEAYLQGKHHMDRYFNGSAEEEASEAGRYFQQAIDADPTFAPAYAGFADSHGFLRQASKDDAAISRRASEKGVALDPNSSDARVTLGNVRFRDFNFREAEEAFRRAIELNSNNALAHQEYCNFLNAMGRLDEGWKECQFAQELDPNQDHLSRALYFKGAHDRAIALVLGDSRIHPDYGLLHQQLAVNYAAKGMYKEYAQELGQMVTRFGHPEITARIDRVLATSGSQDALREFASQLELLDANSQPNFPTTLAQVYTALGNKDRAIYWLERAYENRESPGHGSNLIWLKVDPLFDPLRSDPRFEGLLRRIGLPA